MKYFYYFLIMIVFCISNSCTTGVSNTFDSFISQTNYKVSLGKPGKIISQSGNNRILFHIPVSADPRVSKCYVSWNSGENILDFDISPNTTKSILFDIPEGNYFFEIWLEDDSGNKSLKVEHSATIYGEDYENQLVNRSFDFIESIGDNVKITWSTPENSMIYSEIIFENTSYEQDTVLVNVSENETFVSKYPLDGNFYLRTFFKPDSLSIDTFSSSIDKFSFPSKYKLDPSLINPINLRNDIFADAFGGSLDKLFNGKIDIGDWYHTRPDELPPYHFTFDLGVFARLVRFKLNPRLECCFENTPKRFQLWGIKDTINANPELTVDMPGWEEESRNKGWVLLIDHTESQVPSDGTPIDLVLSANDNFKFLRFVYLESWVENPLSHLSEFEFWADYIE